MAYAEITTNATMWWGEVETRHEQAKLTVYGLSDADDLTLQVESSLGLQRLCISREDLLQIANAFRGAK